MNKPNLFGALADALEKISPDSMSSVAVVSCIAGFWAFTGSFFSALALTLLFIVPLALLVGICIVGLLVGLRLLDCVTSLVRSPARIR